MNRVSGQSMLEMMLVLPIVVVMVAGLVQILWLLLAQQMVQAAAMDVARQASLDGFNRLRALQVVEQRMRPLPGKALHVPRITRQHPSDEMIRYYGTYQNITGQGYYVLSSDFTRARLAALAADEREGWLRSRILQVELIWCQPIKVPVIAEVLAYFLRYSLQLSQQYCNAQRLGREPLLAIRAVASHQLVASLKLAVGGAGQPPVGEPPRYPPAPPAPPEQPVQPF